MAAVLEMLIQSYHEELHLLPALPAQWRQGVARGLRARGGFSVDVSWQDGALAEAVVGATVDRVLRVWDPDQRLAAHCPDRTDLAVHRDASCFHVQARAGDSIVLRVNQEVPHDQS